MATTANEYDWSSGKPVIAADINSDLDYSRDWTEWLNGDTIVTFLPVFTPGVKQGANASTNTTTSTTIWATPDQVDPACKVGAKIAVTHRIVTAAGRKEDFTIYLKLEQH